MKLKSMVFDAGTYQYEFRKDYIAVVKWDEPPASSDQWVTLGPHVNGHRYRLEGTHPDDVCVVPVTLEEEQSEKDKSK